MYLSDYPNDIAVSYAAADNIAFAANTAGWVDTLLDTLRKHLNLKLGLNNYQLWSRQQLAGNQIDSSIATQLHSAATVIVLLSPSYLQDPEYQAELEGILQHLRDTPQRLFVLEFTQVERPTALQQVEGYRLWIPDDRQRPRTLGLTGFASDTERNNYFHQLEDVATDIVAVLQAMQATPASEPAPESLSDTPQVFLAEVTDDLYMLREAIKRDLQDNGIRVLPEQLYSFGDDGVEWQAAVQADLDQALLFVQLLSDLPAMRPAGMSTPQRQFEQVQHHAPQLPILQWRSPDIAVDTVQDAALKNLLTGAQVRVNPLEKFKAEILRQVTAALQPKPMKTNDCQTVFINAWLSDLQVAEQLGECACQQYQWLCALPLALDSDATSPQAVWADFEANLSTCDALLLLYGESPPTWVRQQLMQTMKIIAQREPRPFVALCELEPLPKPDLRLRMPDFIKVLNCDGEPAVGILQRCIQAMEVQP